ncbi:MAG: hypothetical protein O7B99_12985 [Planctomycetota bacterium]|nr:hypothetical protein [Planctomycetota bacterium]
MKIQRIILVCTLLLVVGGLAFAQQEKEPLRYVRVKANDAKITNLRSRHGAELLRPAKGSIVAVHLDDEDWLEVEVPGGYAVWIFGRNLKETDEPDVYEVTATAVLLRPRPKSLESYPLKQKLYPGDRARVIGRNDAKLPLAEDWVRVWSPPGVRAWIAAADVEPLPDGEDGKRLWAEAMKSLPPPPAVEKTLAQRSQTPSEASAQQEVDRDKAFREALEAARKLLESEGQKDQPDIAALRAAFEGARELAPSGAQAVEAQSGLGSVAWLEEASALRVELELERKRVADELARGQAEIRERSKAKDPLGDVFLSRGALERVVDPEGHARYYVRFGRKVVSELVCVSGRYDLDVYTGYEIGVRGMDLRSPAGAEGPDRIEVTRLEVLARR